MYLPRWLLLKGVPVPRRPRGPLLKCLPVPAKRAVPECLPVTCQPRKPFLRFSSVLLSARKAICETPACTAQSFSSALVSHYSAIIMDLRDFVSDSSLHPFGSVGLRLPYGFTSGFGCTGSASVLWHPGWFRLSHSSPDSTLVSRTFSVARTL